jgi:hypothetical protein
VPSLPTVGGSSGTWGDELNAWLLVAHKADGTLKDLTANLRTASYTLVLTDAGLVVEMNVAGANTLTIPPNSSVPFPIGTVIEILQYGAGQTTIAPGSGVSVVSPDNARKLRAQYSSVSLRKRATDTWVMVGDLVV